jgi:methionyl aminopeptidase
MISRNDFCWCGSGKKWKKCHYPHKPSMTWQDLKLLYKKKYDILLKDTKEIEGIKKACQFTARVLKTLCEEAKAGVTTKALDLLARDLAKKAGATSASLGYGTPPFPGAICTSLNEVICHGIPDDIPLKEGDIINIDTAFMLNGYFGDCSAMVCIGNISEEKQLVVDVAYEAMMRAISILKPGLQIQAIGEVIESYALSKRCSVVNSFVSHGVGLHMHEEPQIPHHFNTSDIVLAEGMTFTIEPMINAGARDSIIDSKDGWTARTSDGKPSAQWEHSVLITQNGYEILTIP